MLINKHILDDKYIFELASIFKEKGWIIEDDNFFNTKLTRFSLVFKEGISRWLDSYTYKEKKIRLGRYCKSFGSFFRNVSWYGRPRLFI